jgi:PAS domain S-box-containing protein
MIGNQRKKPSAAGRDDARSPINQPESLPHSDDGVARGEIGRRPSDETESLRESQKSIEALHDSEARFRSIFENAAVGIARVAPDGHWLEVNQRLCDIVGYTREELMTKTFGDITHPDDLEGELMALRRMLAGEVDTYLREKRYRRKDGTYVWAALTSSLIRKADDSPDYFISVIEDISARKQVEENLRESEERFRILADTAPVMVWGSGVDKLRVYFNKQWLDFTGRAMKEELGAGWTEGVHREDYDRCLEIYVRSFEAREPFEMEYRLRRYDGEYRWVLDHGVPRYSPGGDFLGYIGSCIDITERRQAEATVRESEARFQQMADTAPAMLWVTEPDARCTFVSRGWYEFTGQTEQEALGKGGFGWLDAVHPDDREESGRIFLEANRKREPFTLDYRLRRSDGVYRWAIDTGRPHFDKAGVFLGYVGSVIDITERKQAEAEREQLAQEQIARATAEAANRSKDEFLAMVSHELRSPLNAILGYARMLRSGAVDGEDAAKAIAVIERSAKAQLQIIEDLLDSARIIAGKLRIEPGPVDLVPVLDAALDTARSAAEAKGVTLSADFGALPEQVLGDPTRLQQVVWNLLTNAVKFTPEGGRVGLRMDGDADSVRITVSDTGKGIEPEFLPFIFEHFRQADPSSARRYGGLGLGLSLVKHLVELHGGTITAASEGKGRGAAFTVTLPRRQFEFIAPPPAVAHREVRTEGAIKIDRDLSLEGMSVLVVDDQEEARELLVQTLGDYGARVTAVSSGAEALAFLSDPPGGKRPDALILDIAMPGEDGYTVLKKARALEAARGAAADQIPAIALTAHGRSEDRLRALKEGFQMHVTKPVEPAELAVVIASVTARCAWERERKE